MAGFRQTLDLIIRSDTSQATSGIRNFQTTWTELLSKVNLAERVIRAVGAAAGEAFDFAQQGATVVQTAESFDTLLNVIGAAPDLLDQLRQAAGGTIDDLTLMSATSTLLAGTQGDVALALANSTPQLLEIARAASLLNPSLGDTAFLYESLATGIKRSSPLILDNLGLTIKIGDANEEYAASIGKTVEELSAQDKQVALLNATLEAGDVLIQQVGGSLDSATDEFSRLTAEATNAKNALAAAFSETGTVQGVISDLSLEMSDGALILDAYNQGLISGWEALGLYLTRSDSVRGSTEDVATRIAELSRSYDSILTPAIIEAARETASFDAAMLGVAASLGPAADGIEDIGEAAEDSAGSTNELSESLNALEANLNLDSAIERMIEQLEFAAAGGLELQQQLEEAKQAYLDGDLDEAGLQATLQRAFVEAQELQVALGNITADEAAQNIANTLNISLSEARNLMNGIVDGLNNLNGQEFSAEFSIFVSGLSNLREAWRLLGLVGGAGGGGGSGGGSNLFNQLGGPVGAGQLTFVGEAGREIFIPQGATSGTGDDIILIGEDGPTLFIPEKSGHILSNSETEAILRGDRTIPKYEHGGPVGAGQLAIVGERGPELFVPNQSGTVISNEQLAGLGQHNTFIINDAMAAALILADQDIMRRDRFNNRMGI